MKYALLSPLVLALTAVPLTQQPPVTRTTTTGVVIDVSVVDRDGMPVLDLRPDEFELSEDGKRQQIISGSVVHGGVIRALDVPITSPAPVDTLAAASQAPPTAPPTVPENTPSVTAILFDRLSHDVRPWAHRAARAFLTTMGSPREYAGVFLADQRLMSFASFTNDAEVLRAAVDRLGITAPSNVSPEAERAANARALGLPLDPDQPVTPGAEAGAGWINAAEREKYLTGSSPEVILRLIQLRMFETFRAALEDAHGHASLAGLRAIVDAVSVLPGRKSILFFCEALPLTDAVKPKFEALIQAANRNNITFYTIDAVGLRVHSEEAKVRQNVELAGSQGLGDAQRGTGAWTKDIERQSQLLASRAGAVLGRLAQETGGFLVQDTNNLTAGVARMQQERTTYYLLAYQPTNTATDGKFRRVSVKVKRPRVTVRARPGYVAARQP